MSYIPKIRIISELGELEYKQASDLNLNFSRIVDDFSDIENRFGDFSYTFKLPITKNNSKIFGSPETIGSKRYFVKNRNISCKVYDRNQMLLDGLINLENVSEDAYECKFYSKFKELIDSLNDVNDLGEKKTLKDLNFPVVEDWNYESSIITHIAANYKNSDETFYQYPLSFYSTFYCQNSYYTGYTDYRGQAFDSDRPRQEYYYLLNSIGSNKNRIYFHQVPPCVYLVSIVEQILEDAGWTLGGQFFTQDNIKKIVLLYNGEDDPYDKAISGLTIFSGSTPVDLQIAKFLPDMSQSEFLKGVMNMFNLYFLIDTNNKIISFETYDTFFRATDGVDPYDITSNVDLAQGYKFSYLENNNPSIMFQEAGNRLVLGDNRIMSGATDSAFSTEFINTSGKAFNQTFNRIGFIETSDPRQNTYGSEEEKIKIPFAEPTVMRKYIWNDYDIFGGAQNAEAHYVYIPILSKQTVADNNGMKFNKKNEDTYLQNNESSIKFQGKPSLMYYYGEPTGYFENKSGKGELANYLYYHMYTGSTAFNVRIPIVSPFQLISNRTAIDDWLNNVNISNADDRRTTVASYLQGLYQMLGSASGFTDSQLTNYSLVFDDNGYFHETLWSMFHKHKYDRYQQSEIFEAEMIMTSYDWHELQINRPVKYRGELYSIVSIEAYNPITQKATIKLVKKL